MLRPAPARPGLAGMLNAVAFAVVLTGVCAACANDQAPSPDAVARLAGREIPYPLFEDYLSRNLGEVDSALPSEVLSQLFDRFLDELLLAQLATERGLATLETPSRQAVGVLLTSAPEDLDPGDEAVAAYYNEHRQEFVRPERVHLAQILVEDRSRAEEALRALAAGEDFAAVAQRLSEEPGAAMGGDQGELARGDLPPAFVEPIFALSPGQTSGIIEADYGFHIFKVFERLPAEELPLSSVEVEIREILRRRFADERLADLIREARTRYNPRVYERNLPFNYYGRYSTPTQ